MAIERMGGGSILKCLHVGPRLVESALEMGVFLLCQDSLRATTRGSCLLSRGEPLGDVHTGKSVSLLTWTDNARWSL
jgi:hypothetical protein